MTSTREFGRTGGDAAVVDRAAIDTNAGTPEATPPAQLAEAQLDGDGSGMPFWVWFVIGVGGLSALGAAGLLLRPDRRRKVQPLPTFDPVRSSATVLSSRESSPGSASDSRLSSLSSTVPDSATVVEDRTVKFYAPPAGTIKIFPGRLDLGGPEKNSIRFFAVPTNSGATEVTFGRQSGPPYTHVQLKPTSVSSLHATLRIQDGKYEIKNNSKTNATRVNSQPITESWMELKEGDTVEMGEASFVFHSA